MKKSTATWLGFPNRPRSIQYRDIVHRKLDSGLVVIDYSTPYKINSVVTAMNDMARAFGAFLADDVVITTSPEGFRGIQYHAFGEGDPSNPTSFQNTAPSLDEHSLFDERYRKPPTSKTFVEVFSGTGETAGSTTTLIDSSRTEPDDFFNDDALHLIAGTGAGEVVRITDYVQSTGVVTFAPAISVPTDATTEYEIVKVQDPAHPVTPNEDRRILQVMTRLNFHEPEETGGEITIREQGLFSVNATEETDSGFCVLTVRHADLPKTSKIAITRFLRISLY